MQLLSQIFVENLDLIVYLQNLRRTSIYPTWAHETIPFVGRNSSFYFFYAHTLGSFLKFFFFISDMLMS